MNHDIRRFVEACMAEKTEWLHKGMYCCWGRPIWDCSKMETFAHKGDLLVNGVLLSLYQQRFIRHPTDIYWGYGTGHLSWFVGRNGIVCGYDRRHAGHTFKIDVIRECHRAAGIELVEKERQRWVYKLSAHELERRYYMAYPRAVAPDGRSVEFHQRNNVVVRIIYDVFPEGTKSAQHLYLVSAVDMLTNKPACMPKCFGKPYKTLCPRLEDEPSVKAEEYMRKIPVAKEKFRVRGEDVVEARYKWEPWMLGSNRRHPAAA